MVVLVQHDVAVQSEHDILAECQPQSQSFAEIVDLREMSEDFFLVAIDGRSEKCKEGTKLTLRRAPYDVKVVKRSRMSYFNTLREKMMWGIDAR